MNAIRTRYHGPTNYRGSRIAAEVDAYRRSDGGTWPEGRLVMSYDHRLSEGEPQHRRVAIALAERLGWLVDSDGQARYELVSGYLPGGDYAHTLVPVSAFTPEAARLATLERAWFADFEAGRNGRGDVAERRPEIR